MTTMTIDTARVQSAASTAAIPVGTSTETNSTLPAPRGMPASVPADELYYWSESWQAGEGETRESLARGEGRTFNTAKDAIRYLLTND